MTKEPVSWETIEHAYYEKTSNWYWLMGIAGGTIAIVSMIFGNMLLGVTFVIATGAILVHGARVPGTITITLNQNGIRVGKTFYPYANLSAFSIDEESNPLVLALDTKGFINPDVRVFIENTDPEIVRDFLLDHLSETYHQPSLIEGVIHYLGF